MLWVPNEVADAIMHEADGRKEAARAIEFSKRLKALDSRLDCFLQTQNTEDLREGFYYVVRHNEDGTKALWEIRNPDGSFREPDEAVIAAFQRNDANRTNLTRAYKEQEERRRDANKRKAELAREETRNEVADRMKYLTTIQRDIPKAIA